MKINESFIGGLGADPACDAVARATLGMGQSLGIATWWAGLPLDEQSEIFSGRWEPLPEWVTP